MAALHGHEIPFDGESDDLVEALADLGLQTRQVDAAWDDLAALPMPLLLPLKDGGWWILREVRSGQAKVEPGDAWVSRETVESRWQGLALEVRPALPRRGGLWARMAPLPLAHLRAGLEAMASALALQGLGLLAPWLLALAVDQALPHAAPSLLGLLAWGLAATALFRAFAGWLRDLSLQAFSMAWEAALTRNLMDHVLALPLRSLQRRTLGELLQGFAGLQQARVLVLNRGLAALLGGVGGLAYLAALFFMLPGSGLPWAVLGLCLLLALGQLGGGLLQARLQGRVVSAAERQRTALAELIHGMSSWKATGTQEAVLSRWEGPFRQGLGLGLRKERLELGTETAQLILSQGLTVAVLLAGASAVMDGSLSLGRLLAFSQLAAGLQGASSGLAATATQLLVLRPQIKVLQELYALEPEPPSPRRGPSVLPGPIRVEDLWFRYETEGPWILQGRRLEIAPGTFHHVQGPSGSGKSTLLKVMAGLYPPDQGRVTYGGLEPRAAASLVAFLPQFPQLVGGTLRENLQLLGGGASLESLLDAARDTGLAEWVGTLPMGYETHLASGGGNLSGGQRQLLAITALLASGRQVLLLDEALSSLDWTTRRRILQCPGFKGRTIVYASHEEIWRD